MRYIGSKTRIAKIISHYVGILRKPGQLYVEPFCGGCNILDKISNPRLANDNNRQLIALLKAVQTGWIPPTSVTEAEYDWVKLNMGQYPDYYVGFIGLCCSFGGGWWAGYARGGGRNHVAENQRNLLSQDLKDVVFHTGDYRDLKIPAKSFIYCDPPYRGTRQYSQPFDHEKFYTWCVKMREQGHTLLISELDMPANFSMLHQVVLDHRLDRKDSYTKTEKLWTLW